MVKETVITFISRIILLPIGVITSIIIARLLGPEGKGILTVVITSVSLLGLGGNLGIDSANVYLSGQRRYNVSILLWNSIIIGFIIGLLLIGIAWILYGAVPRVFQGVSESLVLLYALSLPFSLTGGYIINLILGIQRFTAYNIINVIIGFLALLAYLIFLFVFPTVKTAIIISIALSVFGLVLPLGYLLWKTGNSVLVPSWNLKVLKESISYGLKGQIGDIIQFLNYRLDMLLVNWFIGPVAVGLYAVAVGVTESLWHVSGSIATVLFPKVSSEKDPQESIRLTAKSSRVSFSLALLMALVLVFCSSWLVPLLFGPDFSGSVLALNLLLPGIVVLALAKVIACYIAGKGFPHYNTIIAGVSFILTFTLDILLIPIWDIEGAAIATTVAYIVSTISTIYIYQRMTHSSLKNIIIFKAEDWLTLKNFFRTKRG